MDFIKEILARFEGNGSNQPVFMPDLTLWYEWHHAKNTLPVNQGSASLSAICQELGCPTWQEHTPWRMAYDGIEVVREETEKKRSALYKTKHGDLAESWTLGPDGDWWKTEYPVKTEQDISAFEAVVDALEYIPELVTLQDSSVIPVTRLPQAPYSDMLQNRLGWSDGLMLMMGAEQERLEKLLEVMEEKRQRLIQALMSELSPIVLAPDNLDGQYVSPNVFENYLEESYQKTAESLHQAGKRLVVHIGGFSKHLLPLFKTTGVDGLSGVSGPPQSNATLAEARESAGPEITLWGGIPQDFLITAREEVDLITSIDSAISMASGDGRMIVGIADHVPVDADFTRLKMVSERINGKLT